MTQPIAERRGTGTAAAYEEYLSRFPNGQHAEDARRLQTIALDDDAYEKARRVDTVAAYEAYLRSYPSGRHAEEARRRQEGVQAREDDAAYRRAQGTGTAAAYEEYLSRFPNGQHAEDARRLQTIALDDDAYEKARRVDTVAAYEAYLRSYPSGRHVEAARRLLEERREAESLRPGERFRDCDECPELVVVARGTFSMGSPEAERWRNDNEGPRHQVAIEDAFAVGVHEITIREYGRFVQATGRPMRGSCRHWKEGEWKNVFGTGWKFPGFSQTEEEPVVCVNWEDAQAYGKWLSRKTGEEYRLLSESEWEYVARAGTSIATYWGDQRAGQCLYANGADLELKRRDREWQWSTARCNDGHYRTAPIRTYKANDFGLFDVLGNVWEWTQDCWNENYDTAPSDGSVWGSGDCGRRVIRGGSWISRPTGIRLAVRLGVDVGHRSVSLGFRVSRMLKTSH